MSISEFRRFAGDVEADPALRAAAEKHAQSAQASLESLIAFAAARGYRFTASELEAGVGPAGRVLTDSQLDHVAGAGPASIDPSVASLLKPWIQF